MLNLHWRDIGDDAINLADSKTGQRDPDTFLFPTYAGRRPAHGLMEPAAIPSGRSASRGKATASVIGASAIFPHLIRIRLSLCPSSIGDALSDHTIHPLGRNPLRPTIPAAQAPRASASWKSPTLKSAAGHQECAAWLPPINLQRLGHTSMSS